MLPPGIFQNTVEAFIKKVNETTQEDKEKVIREFCAMLEGAVDARIKKISITIPAGLIQVQGPSGLSTNVGPIVITNPIIT